MSWFKRFFNLNVNEWWKAPEPIEEKDVTCTIDEEDVDCLVFKLIDKGFHFNVEEDWYERTWVFLLKQVQKHPRKYIKRKENIGRL